MIGRILIIAGSDSGGGAGIQADIKTVTSLNGYAATALTALTAQNTCGVHQFFSVDKTFVCDQIVAVLNDIGADCIKIGMLSNAAIINTVYQVMVEKAVGIPIVLDPVMVAKGGEVLLDRGSIKSLRDFLLPLAYLLTPNIPEAETLLGAKISSVEDMKSAAKDLKEMGPKAVLVKGGHMTGDNLTDVLLDSSGYHHFDNQRVKTHDTHGTGCTLSSAIATGIAQGLCLREAIGRGQSYVISAIQSAPGYGRGHGPINHCHTVRPFQI